VWGCACSNAAFTRILFLTTAARAPPVPTETNKQLAAAKAAQAANSAGAGAVSSAAATLLALAAIVAL